MLDNEEVGSSTRQGAQSHFLRDLLDRILDAVPHSGQAMPRALANSFCLSADNAHATHPNFPEKSDPASPIRLGGGVVIKYNASQKYSTNAYSGAVFGEICRMAGVPTQRFANRADVPGGSTLGNLQANTVPVPTADIGLPQLAMHSAVETAACADADAMRRAVAAFYRAHIRATGRRPLHFWSRRPAPNDRRDAMPPAPAGGCTWATCAAACWPGCLPNSQGGRVVLRIEDLDAMRCPRSFADLLEADLAWLGLSADEGGSAGGPSGPLLPERAGGSSTNITMTGWRGWGWCTPASAPAASCTRPARPTAATARWSTPAPAGA